MLMSVHVGSEWTVAGCDLRDRVRVRVEEVRDGIAHCRSVASGRKFEFRVGTLARGKRGASLVLNADGTPYEKPAPMRPTRASPTSRDEKTASDFRRVVSPKSMPSARAREAAALVRGGMSRTEVAKRFGVSVSAVGSWIVQVREEGPGT
jgi:DNA-directed RNA polymerase specialized sigma24 family protein